MLATLIDKPFNGKGWVYEIKWDGFRIIAVCSPSEAILYSRNGIDVTKKYPRIAAALRAVKRRAVIDGELVALARGRSSFQLLQNVRTRAASLQYVAFDLLFIDGKDLRKRPLLERKKILKTILPQNKRVVFSEHVQERGIAFFTQAKRKKLEGIIAKRAEGKYYSGKRTREWLKIKTGHEQEVVIVGFTAPRNSRKHFGALVLAVRERNKWRYAGRAGTGFDAKSLAAIHAKMRTLIVRSKPFAEKVPDEAHTTWLKPKLVGEVQFTEWTERGEMRHPAFKGLRTDKKATEVIRERPS